MCITKNVLFHWDYSFVNWNHYGRGIFYLQTLNSQPYIKCMLTNWPIV
ncbi:uncharacterized protein M6B38_114785 [Iris pallida]|uniref:Uncharacterized protein n=1 Tax=Iris pallida TaxID=29817 RepID=A0AAX6IC47_IRIPA|nr:uncharacterized protein M6B38_114785 [Iris pallida]